MNRTGATRPLGAAESQPDVTAIRPLRRLWLALTLSSLGHWLSVPALTAMAGALTAGESLQVRAQTIAGVLVLMLLPALLLGPVAVLLVRRPDRRVTMAAADVLRFALVVSVPLVDAVPWTLAVAFLVAFVSLLWIPVAGGALPAPADAEAEERYAAARRSIMRGGYGSVPVAAVLFAVLALIAQAAFGASGEVDLAVYVTALIFLVAAGATFTARELSVRDVGAGAVAGQAGGPAGGPGAGPVGGPAPGLGAVSAPLRLLFQGQRRSGRRLPDGPPVAGAGAQPGGAHAAVPPAGGAVRGLAPAGTVVALAVIAVLAVARLHARDLGGGDAGYGSVLAGLAIGVAFGLFLGPRMLAPFSRRRLLGLAVIAAALALIPVALVRNLPVVVFLAAFLGLACGISWAVAARLPADAERSFAYLRAVALVTGLVAVAAVPPLAGLIGAHRISLGGGDYDLGGPGAALLIVAVLAAPVALVAFRRLDDRRGIPLVPDLAAALRGHTYTPPGEEEPGPAVIRDRGVFVAFEGGEGAGKTTQARLAAIWLRDHGYDVVSTQEPGATKIGMRLRAMLLDQETTGLSARAETLLYAADRADHVANVIRPALERGAIVVSDRYVDSSLAYQGFGREQNVSAIARVNAWAIGGLLPDLTVLLELPPETGLGRLASPADRIESEPHEFHERVREGFRALADADPDRYLIVDASRPQAEITREIQYRIREILPDPIPAGTEDVTSTFPAITDA